MLPLPAGKEASSGAGALEYERHRPEQTLVLRKYSPTAAFR